MLLSHAISPAFAAPIHIRDNAVKVAGKIVNRLILASLLVVDLEWRKLLSSGIIGGMRPAKWGKIGDKFDFAGFVRFVGMTARARYAERSRYGATVYAPTTAALQDGGQQSADFLAATGKTFPNSPKITRQIP